MLPLWPGSIKKEVTRIRHQSVIDQNLHQKKHAKFKCSRNEINQRVQLFFSQKKKQSLAYQQNEKKKSFVVRLFKKSVGIFLWIIKRRNFVKSCVQKWCHWRSKIFLILIIKCLETRCWNQVEVLIEIRHSGLFYSISIRDSSQIKSRLFRKNLIWFWEKSSHSGNFCSDFFLSSVVSSKLDIVLPTVT